MDATDTPRFAARACRELCGFDLQNHRLKKTDRDRIYLAVIDAAPSGEEAARDAAAETLSSIAVAAGWEHILAAYRERKAKRIGE